MSAPFNINFVLTVNFWMIFVDLILPKGLEGLDFIHFQCLAVQNTHVLDGAYLQYESAIPVKICSCQLHQYLTLMKGITIHTC